MSLHAEVRLRRGDFTLDVTLDSEGGRTTVLLGPNGSGKSTLLQAIAGLTSEVAVVQLDGRDLAGVPTERRPIGMVFQELRLFPTMSAAENAAFPLRARRVDRAAASARAAALLDRLGLPADRRPARPGQLSGGEAQRVALARALITEPALLLLDEPTSALDVASRAALRPLLRDALGAFPGVRILVTHDPVEALTLGDRLAVLEGGRITQEGTPQELRDRPGSAYIADLVGLNLYQGRLVPLEEGAGRLVTSDGDLTVAWPAGVPTREVPGVTATLAPADVVLHVSPPEGGSARNDLHGAVAAISMDGARARVRLDSHPSVVAEVTLGSIDRLGLSEGAVIWASCKAVELRLQLPS